MAVSGSGSDLLELRLAAAEPTWRPPVCRTEEAHHRGHDKRANEGRVDDDRDGHANTDGFDGDDACERESEEDAGHDRRRTSDQAAAAFESIGDGGSIVTGANPRLLHSREQEYLVVHGQSEHDTEQQHRNGRVERAGRESEEAREMPLIEDP